LLKGIPVSVEFVEVDLLQLATSANNRARTVIFSTSFIF